MPDGPVKLAAASIENRSAALCPSKPSTWRFWLPRPASRSASTVSSACCLSGSFSILLLMRTPKYPDPRVLMLGTVIVSSGSTPPPTCFAKRACGTAVESRLLFLFWMLPWDGATMFVEGILVGRISFSPLPSYVRSCNLGYFFSLLFLNNSTLVINQPR